MKNLLVNCIETFLIYIFKFVFKWHNCYNFLSLIVHFILKDLFFCVEFFIIHMFRDIHKLAY
jgi:hypothetical protein